MTASNRPMAMYPAGPLGRSFAMIMQHMNKGAYAETLRALNPPAGGALLEIGYGTGAFLKMAARQMKTGRLAGVDPSPLMRDMATAKLATLPREFITELRQGDDRLLDWPTASFDCVAAIHSFQFWSTPETSIADIRELLKPGGVLCLCLRSHGANPPAWLPNEISKQVDETDRLISLLDETGFVQIARGAHSSHWQIVTGQVAQ